MDNDARSGMGKLVKWGSWVVMALGVFLVVQTLNSLKDLRTVNPVYNSISVTGKGEVITVPDIASFYFTVTADAKTVTEAQSNVTKKVDTILAELKALGIEDKDIRTSDYSVWPKYTYEPVSCTPGFCPPSRQVSDGYTVNHSMTVKVRKTEDAGKVLSSVGSKGATNVSGLTFTTDDPDKAMAEARAQAVQDAKAKGEELAKNLGVKIVRVVGYYDNSYNPYPMYADGMGGNAVGMAKSVEVAPTLPQGQNKVVANVTVNYEIR